VVNVPAVTFVPKAALLHNSLNVALVCVCYITRFPVFHDQATTALQARARSCSVLQVDLERIQVRPPALAREYAVLDAWVTQAQRPFSVLELALEVLAFLVLRIVIPL